MKKPKVKIDWSVAEDERTWQASQRAEADSPTVAEGERLAAKHREWVIAALLLLGLIGGWVWRRQQMAAVTSNELQSTIIQGAVAGTGKEAVAPNLVDGEMHLYSEMRFYQRHGDQWRRSDPDPQLLGPAQTLEIANFTIHYQAVDAEAVYESAPKLEQLYATLRQDFGLPDAASTYTIEVAADRVQLVTNYSHLQLRMSVPTPILLSAPVEMPPATVLYQAIVYPLTRLALLKNADRVDQRWQERFFSWQSFAAAFALWELWDDGGPLASGHEEVVRWLYENSKTKATRRLLPHGYDRLCRTYHIWQVAPVYVGVPLTCTDADQDSGKNEFPSMKYLAPLTMLQQATSHAEARFRQAQPFSVSVTGETMIEYIVATYGRDKLPELMAALGQYSTLDTLIPALFGVSTADFDAGWQRYLAQHY